MSSIGLALADTLDDLISSRRIEPQLAMKIMQHFDEKIAAVLGEKVKARMSFKVGGQGELAWDIWLTCHTGPPRRLPILRRSLDLCDQGRQVQNGQRPSARGR